ncbi:MAG TPA: ferritin-like domain-containing protein [Alphaproteobacteria bacterium]|jgi:ferritin-like metal-binding protein YciE|nr:ferritin-like domain-containing protein [Alphaproteobacteria bacterium]
MANNNIVGHAKTLFIAGLRDAHAMECQAQEMLERQISRLRHYPRVEDRLRTHLQETAEQIRRLDEALNVVGESRSALKDPAMPLAGNSTAPFQSLAGDAIVRNVLASYAFEHFEIASYESLLAMAEAAKQMSCIGFLRPSLHEERAMADWLAEHLREVTLRHLELSAENIEASR